MQKRLTQGPVMPTMLRFAVPMILGDLLQQCYNIADTLVVGRFIGTNALAAVGSAFTLMTFLTSILLGLAMGSGTVFSIKFGQKDDTGLREGVLAAFVLLAIVTAVLTGAVYLGFEGIIWFLRLPAEIAPLMRTYLKIVFAGLAAIFLYNYFASLLRALGNSVVPLVFLAVSAAALAATRPLVKKLSAGRAVPTNADRVLGRTARVTETIDNDSASGAVYVDGKTWTARSADGEIIPAGELVEIVRMEGVKLIVRPRAAVAVG